MASKHQLLWGSAILILGVTLAVQQVVPLSLWRYLWPGVLVVLGIWLVARAARMAPSGPFTARLVGDLVRTGRWEPRNEEVVVLIGDVTLDLTAAPLPKELTLSCSGLVGDVCLRVPGAVGVQVIATALGGEVCLDGQCQSTLARSVTVASPDMGQEPHTVVLHTRYIVSDVHIARVP